MVTQDVWMKGIEAYMKSVNNSTNRLDPSPRPEKLVKEATLFADDLVIEYEKRFPHYEPKVGDRRGNKN